MKKICGPPALAKASVGVAYLQKNFADLYMVLLEALYGHTIRVDTVMFYLCV